jgi:PAB-dependent poly(A)-specific ribonuclease subunit 2
LNTFCAHPTLSHSLVVAKGGDNSQFHLVNTYNGTVTREVSSPAMITHIQPSHTLVLSGSSDGNLRTHDFRTTGRKDDGGIEGLVLAHVGGVQGLQVSGNYVFTIGWGLR